MFEDSLLQCDLQLSVMLFYFVFMARMLDRDLIYEKAVALCGMCVASFRYLKKTF